MSTQGVANDLYSTVGQSRLSASGFAEALAPRRLSDSATWEKINDNVASCGGPGRIQNFEAQRSRLTAPDICSRSACRESCGSARQGACFRSPAACRDPFAASADPYRGSVSLVHASQFKAVKDLAFIQETTS